MTAQDTEQNQLPVAQIWREAYGFVFSVPLRVLLTALLPLGLYALASSWIQVQFLNEAAAEVMAASNELAALDPDGVEAEFGPAMLKMVEAGINMMQWLVPLLVLGGLAGAAMAAAGTGQRSSAWMPSGQASACILAGPRSAISTERWLWCC